MVIIAGCNVEYKLPVFDCLLPVLGAYRVGFAVPAKVVMLLSVGIIVQSLVNELS
jgi:hypothetical protein